MFFDVSLPRTVSLGGNKHWLLVLDDFSDYCWSFFLKKKDDLGFIMLNFMKNLKSKHKIEIKKYRCGNAGENISFDKLCQKEGTGTVFEYTAPGTPQQNGRVERKFATLFVRVRAMLRGSGISNSDLRKKLWCEAAHTATTLDNVLMPQSARNTSH